MTYFGDGAISEGDVAEAFGFAASYMAPVVFFCQNNQWAISEPVRVQSHTSIAQRGQGYGIPGIQVDGNDVLAVLAATRLALARASAGLGPTLIEAVTYRMGPHTTSDDPTRYRSPTDEEAWRRQGSAGSPACAAARRGPRRRCVRRARGHQADEAATALRRGASPCPIRSRPTCSPTCTPSHTPLGGGAGRLSGLSGRVRGGRVTATMSLGKALNARPAPGHGA